MKVLLFAKNFYTPQGHGGMEKYVYNLVLKLRRRHKVILFIPTNYNFSIKQVPIYHWIKSRVPIMDSLVTISSIAFMTPLIIMKERPQIISAFIPSVATSILFPLAKLFGIKTVINFRGTGDKESWTMRFIESWTFLFCDGIIMNAKKLHKEYEKTTWIFRHHYLGIRNFYIPNAIDTNLWCPSTNVQNKTHDLVYVANMTNKTRVDKKDLKTFYQALKIIKDQHHKTLRVLIIGKYTKSEIEKAIGTFESEFFEWIGQIGDPRTLKEISQRGKIFVMSSKMEGMPNSLMEAMASGIPSIATDVGAVRQMIDDGKNGFIVPPQNPQELAQKIWILVNNSELQEQFSKLGRKKMQDLFGWRKNILMVEKCYEQILKK